MLDQENLVQWFLYSLIVILPFFFVSLVLFNIFPKSKMILRFLTVSGFAFILSVVTWGCLGIFVLVRAEKSFSWALTAGLATFVLIVALIVLARRTTKTSSNSFLFSIGGVIIVSAITLALVASNLSC